MRLARLLQALPFIALLVFASQTLAVPALQLGIQDGVYVGGDDETTYATTNPFTLNAYLDPSKADPNSWYKLSIALVPKTTGGANLGTFTFTYLSDPTTVKVTDEMYYGVPPYELFIASDGGDLGKHDIYETFFYEYSFKFSASQVTQKINTQDPTTPISGTLYLREFLFDISSLDSEYQLHFDLYNTKLGQKKPTGDIDINLFAPFSHDAQSNGHQVPEPGTLVMMGSGLLGLVVFRKKI